MAHITKHDLNIVREKNKDKKIIFCSGSFDLIHAGHVLFFEDCKRHGDILVAMIANDEVLRKNKGPGRPIFNEHVRMKLIDSLKPIDYCLLDEVANPDVHPLHCLHEIFNSLQPDIYVINEDAFDIPYREELVKKYGTKLVVLPRSAPPEFEEISSTKIIEKLKKIGKI